ncbi:MAG: DedA family protein [Candidatus Liptonbacteria bacterium]|nr:DedA family protein [Candidatus Liptonbacteria bacterium]
MDFINLLAPRLEDIGRMGYWLVLLISFAESIAFIGTVLPGTTLVVFSGLLAARGHFSLSGLILFAAAGAVLGDALSYFLGTKGVNFFKNENKLLKLSHLERGEEFFRKHGPKSVFLGRFIGFIRPIIPFVAGLSKMNKWTFLFWNISSAILWAIFYVLIGYFFGGALDIIGKSL